MNVTTNSISNNEKLSCVVVNVLGEYIPLGELENIKVFRVGTFAQGPHSRPRPVKIICATGEKAQAILRMFVAAKKNPIQLGELKEMWMSKDNTKMQLEEIRLIKDQFNQRCQNGEQNLKIVYRRGIPTIITDHPHRRTTTLSTQARTHTVTQ